MQNFQLTPESKKSFEFLRRGLRGSDDAVLEIGETRDQEKLTAIFKDPSHHSREELLGLLFKNYSGGAFGDYQWSKYTGGWTTPKEPTLYGKLRSNYPQFTQLSLDAGFMCHLPQFMGMLENGEIKSTTYEGVRNELKEKLGYTTMYRGMMLTDKELNDIKNGGMLSFLSRHIKRSSEHKDEFDAKVVSTKVDLAVESHFHGEHPSTPYLSVSAYKDVAIAVGRHFGKREVGKKFYLFTLKVPAIDLISYKENIIRTPSKLQSSIEYNPNYSVHISLDGEKKQYKWDEEVESYMFWKIDPEEIVEITQPKFKESSWNGRTVPWE